jgi:hypothetical protein
MKTIVIALGVTEAGAKKVGVDFSRLQFRDLRLKAETDSESMHSSRAAQKLPGCTPRG